MSTYSINREFSIPASKETVWELLSDEDECSNWQSQDCAIGKNIGERVSLFGGWVTGKILQYEELVILSYSWLPVDWGESEPSTVVFELNEISEEETSVILLHTNLPNRVEQDKHNAGWDDQFFGPLLQYLSQIQG